MIVRFFDMPFKKDLIFEHFKRSDYTLKKPKISLPQFAAIFELLGLKVSPLTITNSELINGINFPTFII